MTKPAVVYSYRRLCFKAELIEPLCESESFQIDTPEGSYRMTKSEFYRVFSNVVGTVSYQKHGLYHYPKTPKKALPFLVK